MKIDSVIADGQRASFDVIARRCRMRLPYSSADPKPGADDGVAEVWVDDDLGREGFSYRLESGREGSVHMSEVLEQNRDPGYMRDLFVYRLTLAAQERLPLHPRAPADIIRAMNITPSEFYRLLDTTYYRKSLDRMVTLVTLLGGDVDVGVTGDSPPHS